MNTQLLLCVVIVLIFFVIMFNLCAPKKETFYSAAVYPEPLMSEHSTFIDSHSNRDIELVQIINDLSKKTREVTLTETFLNNISTLVSFKQEVNKKIFKTVYAEAKSFIENIGNITNFKLSVLILILQFYEYTMEAADTEIVTQNDTLKNDDLNILIYIDDSRVTTPGRTEQPRSGSLTDIEKLKLKFDDMEEKHIHIFSEIITKNKENRLKFKFYQPLKQNKIFERLVNRLLTELYLKIHNKTLGTLACPLYESSICPVAGDGAPCQKEKDLHSTMHMCVNKNNKFLTQNCQVMNGYGKKMCESTNILNNGEELMCVYEDLTQKCVNPDASNILLESTQNTETFNECHKIYNNNLGTMEQKCNPFKKCRFKKAKDMENELVGVCYGKTQEDRPDNFCLSISGLNNEDASAPFSQDTADEAFSCANSDQEFTNKDGSTTVAYKKSSGDVEVLKCAMFDNSAIEKDTFDSTNSKQSTNKTFINSNNNMKGMCNGLKDENNLNKCEYIEYSRNIPTELKSKYDKINICIPKGSSSIPNDVNPNLDESTCKSQGGIWSTVNDICINPTQGCNAIKHKEYCNVLDNCLWSSGSSGISDNNQDFYGTCKDISNSLNKVEDLIDNIHEKHISNLIKIDDTTKNVNDMIPNIKNAFSSL
jgi:hypothetical protein